MVKFILSPTHTYWWGPRVPAKDGNRSQILSDFLCFYFVFEIGSSSVAQAGRNILHSPRLMSNFQHSFCKHPLRTEVTGKIPHIGSDNVLGFEVGGSSFCFSKNIF